MITEQMLNDEIEVIELLLKNEKLNNKVLYELYLHYLKGCLKTLKLL